jgi:hypothetical protein
MEAHKISPETMVYCGLGKIRNDLRKPLKTLKQFFLYVPDLFLNFLRMSWPAEWVDVFPTFSCQVLVKI